MTTDAEAPIREAAFDWFARLRDSEADEAAWLAFRDWVEADPRHRDAYLAVEALWLDLDAASEAVPAEAEAVPLTPKPKPREAAFPWRRAAALAVAIVGLAVAGYLVRPEPAARTWRAPADAPLTIALDDGTRIILDRSSELKTSLDRRRRAVELVEGEADFDVSRDERRPFTVAAGGTNVRVLGTRFDVLRHGGRLRVTVSRGVVAVGPSERANVRLTAGEQFEAVDGGTPEVRKVDPADVSGWARGLLIYHDAPLATVAADISRYVGAPVEVDASARAMTFSGVLRIAEGRAMLDRLEAFLSLSARREGATTILSRGPPPSS